MSDLTGSYVACAKCGDRLVSGIPHSCESIDIETYRANANQFLNRIVTLEAENARLREALSLIQWGDTSVDCAGQVSHVCPLCDRTEEQGHSARCEVDAALGRQA